MNEDNAKRLKRGGVIGLIVILGMLGIASNVAVWDAVTGGAANLGTTEVVFSLFNLVAEGGLLWFLGKTLLPKTA